MSNPPAVEVDAAVLHGPGDLRVEKRKVPMPDVGELRIALLSTGVCGSDLHYYKDFRNGDIHVREPLILGHESAGIVTGMHCSTPRFAPGMCVAMEVGLPCEKCSLCRSGRYNLCADMRFRSSARAFPHAQGTLQDQINHPAKYSHRLPDDIALGYGALVEPLAVAVHAVKRANLTEQATVLVMGAGCVGLLVAGLMRLRSAGAVIVADLQNERAEWAVKEDFADDYVVVPATLPRDASTEQKLEFSRAVAKTVTSKSVNGFRGEVTATFECTGAESSLQTAIYSTAPGGKIMLIGMGNPVQTLPISHAALREVDLIGVFRYANDYPEAIELLKEHKKQFGKLISHRFKGMRNAKKALDTAGQSKDSDGKMVMKVVLENLPIESVI